MRESEEPEAAQVSIAGHGRIPTCLSLETISRHCVAALRARGEFVGGFREIIAADAGRGMARARRKRRNHWTTDWEDDDADAIYR